MKTLSLLRHGKSRWDDPALRDFDRPLNAPGRKASALMGEEAARRGLTFERAVVSPALRTVETIALFKAAYRQPLEVDFHEAAYAASWHMLLDIIHAADTGTSSLLIVGHNPGLETLAAKLSDDGAEPMAGHFPTAALCRLRLPIENWKDLRPGTATVDLFLRPNEVEGATD